MPRKKPSNQHNRSHENGIVAPGKPITRQKSNGHINGTTVGIQPAATVSIPSASAAHAMSLTPEKHMNGQATDMKNGVVEAHEQDGKPGDLAAGCSGAPATCLSQSNGPVLAPTTKPVKNTPRGPPKRKDNAFGLALTIIRSCPLADTLTILIILLSIPSTVLTIINILFAMLTFMPPAGSFFALPSNFHDIFQGSGGTPSLATIIITDAIGLLIWLVAWTPVQALAIEYTQAVVAATLGGSNTNKKAGYDSTLLCMTIVTARHVSSRGWIPARVLGFDWRAVLSRIPYIFENQQSFISITNDVFFTTESRGGWGWFRVLLALHILIQGLVHVARRWYQKREYFQPISIPKRYDPEVGTHTTMRPGPSPLADSPLSGNNTPSPSTTARSSLPMVKDTREKASSGKKRRKQAAQVRSQQPLWAAFAATKVTIMREYEHTHSMADFNDSNARDAIDLGNASFSGTEDQMWVAEVHQDRFTFHTTCSLDPKKDDDYSRAEAGVGVDRSKPFYVRVNDTDWTSTKISRYDKTERGQPLWVGIVFGLAPLSSYRCSLFSSEGDMMLSTINVTTSPSLLEDTEPKAASNEPPQRPQRPYSPTSPSTTLKKSISAFEANLNESLARQKRSKKENKATSSNLRKEIEVLHSKITKLSYEDRSHTNRHMQWNQHIKQADDAVIALDVETESLEAIPEDETMDYKEIRSSWESAKQRQKAVRDDLLRCKEKAQREKSMAQNEANSARQKKERVQARISKLIDQLEKLESATSNSTLGAGPQNANPSAKEAQRMQTEQELQNQMQSLHHAWQESRYNIAQRVAQVQHLENTCGDQQSVPSNAPGLEGRPLTPEGDLPGENPQNAASAIPRLPAFGTPDSGGLRSHSGSIRQNDHRLRSSSLQSNNSNHVDFDDQDPAPPMPTRAVEAIREARKRSEGSAGGSSGSNSQRDPASPIGSNRVQDNPFGRRN